MVFSCTGKYFLSVVAFIFSLLFFSILLFYLLQQSNSNFIFLNVMRFSQWKREKVIWGGITKVLVFLSTKPKVTQYTKLDNSTDLSKTTRYILNFFYQMLLCMLVYSPHIHGQPLKNLGWIGRNCEIGKKNHKVCVFLHFDS